MANVEVISLSPKTLTQTLDLYVQEDVGGAASSGKVSMKTMMKGLNPILVYVSSTGGQDISGGGGQLNPYATLEYALSQITDATSTKIYIINMSGNFNETTISLKPWIMVDGQESIMTITNQVVLDASWISIGGTGIFQNFSNLNTMAGLNLDFTGAPDSQIEMENLSLASSVPWLIKGDLTNGTIAILDQVFGVGSSPPITIQDCYGGISGCAPTGLTILATSTVNAYNISAENNVILGEFLVQANAGANISVNTNSNSLYGGLRMVSASAAPILFIQNSATNLSSVTLNGTGITYNTDSQSTAITLSGGATISSNVIYRTLSDGITANYTPVNYTPVNPQVQGHLHGIDNALAAGGSGALTFKGNWNANTNTPTLTNGVGSIGDMYIVSVEGTTSLDGITTWHKNDWAYFNGTVWTRESNSLFVTLMASILLMSSNIITPDITVVSTATITTLNATQINSPDINCPGIFLGDVVNVSSLLQASLIDSLNADVDMNIGENLTTGNCNIAENLTTGALSLGGIVSIVPDRMTIIKKLRLANFASNPASPFPGDMYFNTTSGRFMGYSGLAWEILASQSFNAYTPTISGLVPFITSVVPASSYYIKTGRMVTINSSFVITVDASFVTQPTVLTAPLFVFSVPFTISDQLFGTGNTFDMSTGTPSYNPAVILGGLGMFIFDSGTLPSTGVVVRIRNQANTQYTTPNNPYYFDVNFSYLSA